MTHPFSYATSSEHTPSHSSIAEFLAREAALLDDNRLWEWFDLLDDDFTYTVPIRIVLERAAKTDVSPGAYHQRDTKGSLRKRIERLYSGHAWAEDPPSRTTRLVGSVWIEPGHDPTVVCANSALLLYRERGQDAHYDLISARRRDLIKIADGHLRLLERTVNLAHTALNTPNLAVFL
ncbi:3-phenylpropionate/cinnamic acid dioxygenase subunit beta [Nocardia sp. CWNU-33]|uniref:3-phenylpropionate/cinnamic acid dioxygenase subunit beta n=1 Tax=Nocardia sp. CWNU-33 TaxID=3392117 RepID=UPI00398E7EEB